MTERIGRYVKSEVDLIHSILSFWCYGAVGVTVGRLIWHDHFFPWVVDLPFGYLISFIGMFFILLLFVGPTVLISIKLRDLFEKWAIKEEQIRLEKESILCFIRRRPNLTKNKTEDEIKELMKEDEELSKITDFSWWVDDFHRRQKINKDS